MDDKIASGPDHVTLFEIASEQQGYFTAAQALLAGFGWELLSYHTRTGRFIRVHRGVYRLRDYPSAMRGEVVAAWLAIGKDVAVVSHESALDLLDLSDLIPNAVHLTIPRSRRAAPGLPGVIIHTTVRPLAPDEIEVRDGLPITSVARTILDVAAAGVSSEHVEVAIRQALERGIVTPAELADAAARRGGRVKAVVAAVLERAA